jgi:hypothetical protein
MIIIGCDYHPGCLGHCQLHGLVSNLFGVGQVLSWIAGQRREISEDLEWRSQVQELIAKLDV